MTATIFAGRHEFVQTTFRDPFGVPVRFVWDCRRCGLSINPSEPFTECTGARP